MSITPTKTWEYCINNTGFGTTRTTRNRAAMLNLYEMLTDGPNVQWIDASGANIAASSPWVLIASSDSVTAGAPGPGWTDVSDLVWAGDGVAHSWVHIRQLDYFASGDHLHMLINLGPNTSQNSQARLKFARGPTGYNNDGTNTTMPTLAGDSIELELKNGNSSPNAQMWGSDSIDVALVSHMRMSDDGKAGMWWNCVSSNCTGIFGWQEEEEGPTTVPSTNAFFCWARCDDNNGERVTWAVLDDLDWLVTWDNADVRLNCTSSNTIFRAVSNQIQGFNQSADRWLEQIKIADVLASFTVYGLLTDIWIGSNLEGTGDLSPATPPAVRAQIGEYVIPWPSGQVYTVVGT